MHSINQRKYRIITLLMLVSLSFGLGHVASGQTKTPELSNTLKELLDLPSPPPNSAFFNGASVERYERIWAATSVDPTKPPPDNAPTIDLIRYWLRWNSLNEVEPSDVVRNRLFEAFLEQPDLLSRFLRYAPVNDQTIERCKSLYDKAKVEHPDEPWTAELKEFLLYRSRYFLDELIELASDADKSPEETSFEKIQAVRSLADVDWETAQPIVMNLLKSSKETSSLTALTLLYQHARKSHEASDEEKYRKSLLEVAANRSTSVSLRERAITELSTSEWSGRDEWYLSLFQDESFLEQNYQRPSFSPMVAMLVQDPEKWRPILIKLIEGKDKIVRSNAARCFLPFYSRPAKAELLKPLLPWLSDPNWAISNGTHRFTLIQALENVDLPESVPGLMWVVEHDVEPVYRSRAAASLARYADPRAIPMLRKALAEETEISNRSGLIRGLIGSKGLTDEEQLAALESFVQATNGTVEGASTLYTSKNVPVEQVIGSYLSFGQDVSISLARLVLNRAETLKQTNPKLSSALIAVVHRWPGKHIDLDIVSRIADGTLPAQTLSDILRRQELFSDSVRPELEAMAAAKGTAAAIAAVLLNNATLAESVLGSKDEMAHVALLATARLTKMPLPLSDIEPFLNSKNSLLARAAEAYLLAQDTTETRQMLWRNRPDQAFITGWLGEMYATDKFAEQESKLQKELFSDESLVDIIAVIGSEPNAYIVRIYKDKTMLQVATDRARYSERELAKVELKSIRDALETVGFMELGAQLSFCHHGCPTNEILTLTRSKGRRVLTQTGERNPVAALFSQLATAGKFKVSYHSKSNLPDLEILYDDETPAVRNVALDGNVIKVQVERKFTAEEEAQEMPDVEGDEGEEVYTRYELWEKKRQAARLSWRILKDGVLAEEIATPASHFSQVALKAIETMEFEFRNWTISASPNSFAYATPELLIKVGPGGRETQLGKGTYSYPVITADGKWVVAAKEDRDGEAIQPNFLVRINVSTGREFRVDIPEADDFRPMFFVAFRNQILARRSGHRWKDTPVGPVSPEYYLLDPVTGKSQQIKGNFEPFEQLGERFFQSSSRPEEYWVALRREEKDETQLGLYSFKDFSFRPLLTIPKIQFNSQKMWVDESAGKVYVAYEGQLLRFSLRLGGK